MVKRPGTPRPSEDEASKQARMTLERLRNEEQRLRQQVAVESQEVYRLGIEVFTICRRTT